MAPLAYQSDPDGTYHDLAVQLRNIALEVPVEEEDGMTIVESADMTEDSPKRPAPAKTARGSETPFIPPATPARLMEEMNFKKQQEILTSVDGSIILGTRPTPIAATPSNCMPSSTIPSSLCQRPSIHIRRSSLLLFPTMGVEERNKRARKQRTDFVRSSWQEIHLDSRSR